MKLFFAVLFPLFFVSFQCAAASSSSTATTSAQKSSSLSSVAKSSNTSSSLRTSSTSSRSQVSSTMNSSRTSSSVISNGISSSASSNSQKISRVIGPVTLFWRPPFQRESGKSISAVELGGYELRYKLAGSNEYTYIVFEDPYTNFYIFQWLEGDYIFQVAAYDKAGIYSDFIDIGPAMTM